MMGALGQLVLMRLRILLRQPEVLFWTFIFPVVTTLVLGLAFRDEALAPVRVAVAEGPGAQALVARLEGVSDLQVRRLEAQAARRQLTRGQVALVLLPGQGQEPEALVDPSQPEGRTARLLVAQALASAGSGPRIEALKATPVSEPGNRYVDFLVPGLLGLSLMSTSMWTLASSLVTMRGGKLLKRMAATPMSRPGFFVAFILARGLFGLLEVLFFCAYAQWLFDVPMLGSYALFIAVGLLGALCFAALGLLTAVRVRTEESINGLVNLVTLPMMFLSGVFFSAENFPDWLQPVIRALPLTALNDALRAIMLEGAGLVALGTPVLVMVAWTLIPTALTARWFRWV